MYWPQHAQLAAPAVGYQYGVAQQAVPQYAQQYPGYGQLPAYGQYPASAGWPQAGFATSSAGFAQAGFAASSAGFAQYPQIYSPTVHAPPLFDPVQSFIDELGISPEEDAYFGWLAEYGLQDDVLPPDWSIQEDASTGRLYYVDGTSGSSAWENPLSSSLLTIIQIGRHYLHSPSDDFFDVQKQALQDQHAHSLSFWHGPLADDAGRQYFSNSSTGVSSWRDPREETQFMFELESTLLDALREILPSGPDVLPVFGGPTSPTQQMPLPQSPESPTSPLSPKSKGQVAWDSAAVSRDEHKQKLDEMKKKADHQHYLRKDSEEAQLLVIARKVRERRKRLEKIKEAREQARKDEEARGRGFKDAEDEKQYWLRQKSLAEQEAIRKREEAEAEAERQRQLAEEEAARKEEEAARQAAEKRRQAEEEAARKEAERKAEERRVEEARQKAEAAKLAKEAREKFLASIPEVCKSKDVKAINVALADGKAFGFAKELEPLSKALEEELHLRKAVALKARQQAEELASQFKNAKEAQDFGGAILAAQWRAAVREVAKPFQE